MNIFESGGALALCPASIVYDTFLIGDSIVILLDVFVTQHEKRGLKCTLCTTMYCSTYISYLLCKMYKFCKLHFIVYCLLFY